MNVLVIRFSSLGDVCMTIPVLHAALEQNPDVSFTVLSNKAFKDLFEPLPRTTFIGADLSKKGKHKTLPGLLSLASEIKKTQTWDAIADLHHVLRSQTLMQLLPSSKKAHIDKGRTEKKGLTRKHRKNWNPLKSTHQRYADVLASLGLSVDLSKYQSQTFCNLLGTKDKETKHIGIAPFAKHEGKQFPLHNWPSIVEVLQHRGYRVTFFGNKEELDFIQSAFPSMQHIEFAKPGDFKAELKQMTALDAMLCMDSANMHLASLVGTRVISIWGATHHYAGFLGFGQSENDIVAIPHEELNCRPCSVFGNKPCHRKDYACLTTLSAKDTILSLLNSE